MVSNDRSTTGCPHLMTRLTLVGVNAKVIEVLSGQTNIVEEALVGGCLSLGGGAHSGTEWLPTPKWPGGAGVVNAKI